MKKRIKDLTEEELKQICSKNGPRIENCKNCPLYQQEMCTRRVLIAVAGTNFFDREVYIPQPHILDKQEHDYLRAVCKPYNVKYIYKTETGSGKQFIHIVVKSSICCGLTASWSMPFFKSNTMYKGMETNRNYTIQELELDKEWEE